MHLTRREFIGTATAGSLVSFLGTARPAGGVEPHGPGLDHDRVLVLLQLSGGNDALSTLVPHGDAAYARNRSRTLIETTDVLCIDDHVGLHPALAGFRRMLNEGKLAVVQGVGYPLPDRSHFKSLDIWHAADHRGRSLDRGWIGRLVDAAFAGSTDPNLVVHIGERVPFALRGRRSRPVAFTTPAAYRWTLGPREAAVLEESAQPPSPAASGGCRAGALAHMRAALRDARSSSAKVRRAVAGFEPRVEPPATALGTRLTTVAAMIAGGLGTRIYSLEMGGFDTHVNQRPRHDRLMRELDGALTAFIQELEARELAHRVCVVAFSEFGRRVRENGSAGTDHGAAGHMFLAGPEVAGGLHGEHPSLTELDAGDLAHTVDFRRVYAAVIRDWMTGDVRAVLGNDWKPLAILSPP